MAYDQDLALRVRGIMVGLPGFAAKKMFGGVGYMLRGNMACGVHGNDLIVRVGPEGYQGALAEPGTREFDMTGRPMKGWVVVTASAIETDDQLDRWVQRGVDFALSLPEK
jgi:TfoX/Sxy family transcriptional regulator of competence genes